MSSTSVGHFEARELDLHGHQVVYRIAGSGPPVVLVHGMVNSSRHWERVALRLAKNHTVIAPDLIGHGEAATSPGDYSLGAHAASIRDLLAVLGIDRATFVGHSYGGGVAMIFFYQFPQRIDRLVLVSSGGLGHEVSPMLRMAALPGAAAVLSVAARKQLLSAMLALGDSLQQRGVSKAVYLRVIARALRPLENPGGRTAFVQTLRSVIDVHGQRVSAQDRLYLLESIPTMIVWGERDNTIPLQHGRDAHAAIPGSTFQTLPRAAHFPHLDDPESLSDVLEEFLSTTEPVALDDAQWGALVASRANAAVAASPR